jgi:outer membrane protein OmpA-like peptidoglycan-associated protein
MLQNNLGIDVQKSNRKLSKLASTAMGLGLFALLLSGCSTMTKSQKGAVIGGAGGAVVGGVVGRIMGKTAMGAIIGAAAGGVAGAVIGRNMDKQAAEMAKELADAEVIREGEGIVIKFKEKVLFAYNSSDLNATSKKSLDQLNSILRKYPETNITIIGHTDSNGSDSYNQTLSESRSNSVTTYAGQNGIARLRLTPIGKGESDPIATNETDDGRSLNRRVEFVITANEKMKAEAKAEAGK